MKKLLLSALMCLMALSMTAQNAPYVIYDYLKVFPNDLGTFDAEPKTIIARLNQNLQYGYGTWRLSTNEELALMKANNIIADGSYMTRENKKGIVRLVTDREKGETLPPVPQGYVDLGLPSGTTITLPAEGGSSCDGKVCHVGSRGYYWSSAPGGVSGNAWFLFFNSTEVGMFSCNRCDAQSVRLVR